jgi:hypothetical protein
MEISTGKSKGAGIFFILMFCLVLSNGCDSKAPDIEINLWNKHLVTDSLKGADMFTGDIDNDGKEEFVVIAVMAGLKISWYDHELIDGEDKWTETVIDQAENLEFLPADHELLDMDGDGDLDVILAGMCTEGAVGATNNLCEKSQMLWYENVDLGITWEKHVIGEMEAIGANYLDVSDMDGDGDLDVAAGTIWLPVEPEDAEVAWFRNRMDEDGTWEKITISAPGPDGIKYANGICISDLDNDGYPDVSVATSKGVEEVGTVYWFKSPGDTGADWQRFQVDPGMETASWSVFAIDVNNDGFNDLAVGRNDSRISSNPGGIIFYINPKNPENGGTWKQYSFVEGDYKMGPYFNFDDMDGDGELDIVSTYTGEMTGDPGNVSWIKFHFDPIFGLIQDRRVMIATEHLKAWDVHTIDVLGNGKNGVVVSDFIIGNINWYEEP